MCACPKKESPVIKIISPSHYCHFPHSSLTEATKRRCKNLAFFSPSLTLHVTLISPPKDWRYRPHHHHHHHHNSKLSTPRTSYIKNNILHCIPLHLSCLFFPSHLPTKCFFLILAAYRLPQRPKVLLSLKLYI